MNDGFFPLPANVERTTCRSCKAPIAWITTGSGAHMPLDLGTVEQRDGVTMAQTHFAHCPQGEAWSATRYHGPTGDVNNPEAQAAVAKVRAIQKELGL